LNSERWGIDNPSNTLSCDEGILFQYTLKHFLLLNNAMRHHSFFYFILVAGEICLCQSFFATTTLVSRLLRTTSLAISSSTSKGISSYLPSDTYNSLPKDGEVVYLHTMIRSMDLQATMNFFEAIGLRETRRKESESGRFTLVFMASVSGAPEIEITYNWDPEVFAEPSRSMGHLAYGVDDIYALCDSLQAKGITILRPPRDGRMAFIKSPDGISVELLQKGAPLEPREPWASMSNTGSW